MIALKNEADPAAQSPKLMRVRCAEPQSSGSVRTAARTITMSSFPTDRSKPRRTNSRRPTLISAQMWKTPVSTSMRVRLFSAAHLGSTAGSAEGEAMIASKEREPVGRVSRDDGKRNWPYEGRGKTGWLYPFSFNPLDKNSSFSVSDLSITLTHDINIRHFCQPWARCQLPVARCGSCTSGHSCGLRNLSILNYLGILAIQAIPFLSPPWGRLLLAVRRLANRCKVLMLKSFWMRQGLLCYGPAGGLGR